MHADQSATLPDTYQLCQHLSQARAMLGVLGTAAAYAQGGAVDADQLGDYVSALQRLVGDAQGIAEVIEDRCIVVSCACDDTFRRADALRREAIGELHPR